LKYFLQKINGKIAILAKNKTINAKNHQNNGFEEKSLHMFQQRVVKVVETSFQGFQMVCLKTKNPNLG
jgi:hypothetical protein